MAERYGLTCVKAVERLVAVLADAEQAALLGIEVGDPLMAIERSRTTPDDQPLEYSTDLFRGDRTRVIAWAYGADGGHRRSASRRPLPPRLRPALGRAPGRTAPAASRSRRTAPRRSRPRSGPP